MTNNPQKGHHKSARAREAKPTWVRIGDVIDRIFKDGVSLERLTKKDDRQNT